MSGRGTDWLTPQTILAVVGLGAAFVSFWTNFSGRVTDTERAVSAVNVSLKEHKDEEATRLTRMEDKIDGIRDRLVERGK